MDALTLACMAEHAPHQLLELDVPQPNGTRPALLFHARCFYGRIWWLRTGVSAHRADEEMGAVKTRQDRALYWQRCEQCDAEFTYGED